MNGTGSLIMRADKIGADTMLARIVAMVSEAQRSRAPIQALADKVSGYFVPAVLGVAVLAFAAAQFMLRSTTISIRSAISSLARSTNNGEPARWPSGAYSRPNDCLGPAMLRHAQMTCR